MSEYPVSVRNLTMAHGDNVVQRDITFDVKKGEVMVVMGESGCGKSTLLRHLIGLNEPAAGQVLRNGIDLWNCSDDVHDGILRSSGILYQGGALWTSMTLEENVSLPLVQFTTYDKRTIRDIAEYKLSLVGLSGCGGLYPSEISGGMRKRAGLARAMALDPDVLFFDEPSAGLDPLSSRRLDELILELRESLGTTLIVITHELASIFTIANTSIYLDAETRTMVAWGDPRVLRESCENEKVRRFLNSGGKL